MTLTGTVEERVFATAAQILFDCGAAKGRLDVTSGSSSHDDSRSRATTHFKDAF